MNEIQKYIAAHEPKMMDDLFSLIRIPSISALPEHHDDMLACAERCHLEFYYLDDPYSGRTPLW